MVKGIPGRIHYMRGQGLLCLEGIRREDVREEFKMIGGTEVQAELLRCL